MFRVKGSCVCCVASVFPLEVEKCATSGYGGRRQSAWRLTGLEVFDLMSGAQRAETNRRAHGDGRGIGVFILFPRVLLVEFVEFSVI